MHTYSINGTITPEASTTLPVNTKLTNLRNALHESGVSDGLYYSICSMEPESADWLKLEVGNSNYLVPYEGITTKIVNVELGAVAGANVTFEKVGAFRYSLSCGNHKAVCIISNANSDTIEAFTGVSVNGYIISNSGSLTLMFNNWGTFKIQYYVVDNNWKILDEREFNINIVDDIKIQVVERVTNKTVYVERNDNLYGSIDNPDTSGDVKMSSVDGEIELVDIECDVQMKSLSGDLVDNVR